MLTNAISRPHVGQSVKMGQKPQGGVRGSQNSISASSWGMTQPQKSIKSTATRATGSRQQGNQFTLSSGNTTKFGGHKQTLVAMTRSGNYLAGQRDQGSGIVMAGGAMGGGQRYQNLTSRNSTQTFAMAQTGNGPQAAKKQTVGGIVDRGCSRTLRLGSARHPKNNQFTLQATPKDDGYFRVANMENAGAARAEHIDLLDAYQDEIFQGGVGEAAVAPYVDPEWAQEQINLLVAENLGNFSSAFEDVKGDPKLYNYLMSNLDAKIDLCEEKHQEILAPLQAKYEAIFIEIDECVSPHIKNYQSRAKLEATEQDSIFKSESRDDQDEKVGGQGPSMCPYGSLVDGTLSQGDDLMLNLEVGSLGYPIIELKREVRRALVEKDENKGRYCFLEEADVFQDTLIIKDQKEDVQIRIAFDKAMEVETSELMKEYMKVDERLKKLVIFLKNWKSESGESVLGRKFNETSLKTMAIAFMQSKGALPNLQRFAYKINTKEYPGVIESIRKQHLKNHVRRYKERVGIDRIDMFFNKVEDLHNRFYKNGLPSHIEESQAAKSPYDLNAVMHRDHPDKEIELSSTAEILVGFLKYFGYEHQEYQAIDISQFASQEELSESTNDSVKLFYNTDGPFAHGQTTMKEIEKMNEAKTHLKDIAFPEEFVEQIYREAEEMIKAQGGDSATIRQFDYPDYLTKKNDNVMDQGHTRFTFSVSDSEYFVAHPFDKMSNVASKEYDQTLVSDEMKWFTGCDAVKVEQNQEAYKRNYVSKAKLWTSALSDIFHNRVLITGDAEEIEEQEAKEGSKILSKAAVQAMGMVKE